MRATVSLIGWCMAGILVPSAGVCLTNWGDVALGQATDAPTPAAMSFKEALARARQHALGPKIAQSRSTGAERARAIADYQDDPTVAIAAAAGATYRETETNAAADDVTKQQSYKLSIDVPLYDFGRQAARLDVAQGEVTLARVEVEAAEETLRFAVARAYLEAWQARRTLLVADRQVEIAAAKLTVQRRNYKMGLRPESDVVTAEVDLGRAEITRATALDKLSAARLRLAELTGSDGEVASEALAAPRLDQIVAGWGSDGQTTTDRRQAAEQAVLVAELDALKADRRPSLAAVVSAEEAGTLTPLRTTAVGQLRLSWDLPWSGMGRAEESLVAQRRQTLELETESLRRERHQTTRLGRDAVRSAVRLASALARQLELAERQARLVQTRYESGQASALEVSTAESTLLTIKLDQIRAGGDAVSAALDVAEAQGVSDLEVLFP